MKCPEFVKRDLLYLICITLCLAGLLWSLTNDKELIHKCDSHWQEVFRQQFKAMHITIGDEWILNNYTILKFNVSAMNKFG